MNKELSELYDKIYHDVSTKNPNTFINLVEDKIHLLEKSDYEDYEDFKKATRLLSDYGIMLSTNGNHKKAIHYLKLAIKQFESDKKMQVIDLLDEPLYVGLLFQRGVSLFKMKNLKAAKSDFSRLKNKFPENNKYISWMNGCETHNLNKISWFCVFFSSICIILSISLKPENGIIDKLSFYGIFVGFGGGLLTSFISKRKSKKITSPNSTYM